VCTCVRACAHASCASCVWLTILSVARTEALSAEFIEKGGVEALTPLLGPANKELQKQAVRTIKNLSKSTSPSPSLSVCVCACVCVCVCVCACV
jgi:hypothetical protein